MICHTYMPFFCHCLVWQLRPASDIMTIAVFSHEVALLFCDTQAIWTDNADLYFCIQNLDESKKTSFRNCKADCYVYIPAVFSP